MKTKRIYQNGTSVDERRRLFAKYDDKYFNLFLSNYKWTGIKREAGDFIMRRLWDTGILCAYRIPVIDEVGFTTFSELTKDQYWYPATVTLINQNGVSEKIIPNGIKIVNKDVVLCYALRTFTPYRNWIENQISKIVDVEMTITSNLFALKNPLLIPITPEQHDKAQDTIDRIRNDEPTIFTDIDPAQIKAISGVTDHLEELYNYKVQLENELLTYMGIDNIGNVEKKERLIKDEANSNNALINDFGDNVLRNLSEFCELVKSVLGFDISVESTGLPAEESSVNETEDKEDDKD